MISTHAPLAGRDGEMVMTVHRWFAFQPTRPLRGATAIVAEAIKSIKISTHAPLAGRDLRRCGSSLASRFQPTRPLRGATMSSFGLPLIALFQPTRPLRGATAKVYKSLCTFLR